MYTTKYYLGLKTIQIETYLVEKNMYVQTADHIVYKDVGLQELYQGLINGISVPHVVPGVVQPKPTWPMPRLDKQIKV